jgi:hypothetical protein
MPHGPVPCSCTIVSPPVHAKWGVFGCMIAMPPAFSACATFGSNFSPCPMWKVPESTVTRSTAGW